MFCEERTLRTDLSKGPSHASMVNESISGISPEWPGPTKPTSILPSSQSATPELAEDGSQEITNPQPTSSRSYSPRSCGVITNGTNSVWSDELCDELRRLHRLKFSGGAIAARLGLTRNQVIGKLFRLGIKGHEAPQHRVARVKSERPVNRRPKLKIVAGGGGSMRVIKTSEADVAPLRRIEIEPRHIAFAGLQRSDCRYPYGTGPYTYCGHPRADGSSYCAGHHALCWMPVRARRA